MKKSVVVLDAQTGNVRSVVRALERVGGDVTLTADQDAIMKADGLVVPGVGAFGAVLEKIRRLHADRFIERRLAGGKAVFGICVGMQIMFDDSDETPGVTGLCQWPGTIKHLDADIVPHMGWSHVQPHSSSQLFQGIENERFYFVHSYGAVDDISSLGEGTALESPFVSWSEHGNRFIAAVENGPLCATQFHPEKSGDAGAQLLKNWLQTF
ncbi:MAG: imidazole glycerol phosphate synthase subunit HisH [Actinomycetaceae bacterium]|nr:imidazole glycerol phosphate synthase subunit HisH [Actinomycetaceae bacterium]